VDAVDQNSSTQKFGWRVREWAAAASVSPAYVYLLLNEQKLVAVKSGRARIILTSPAAYLESLRAEVVEPTREEMTP
jgi:hypothetical protein